VDEQAERASASLLAGVVRIRAAQFFGDPVGRPRSVGRARAAEMPSDPRVDQPFLLGRTRTRKRFVAAEFKIAILYGNLQYLGRLSTL
jgi:hypothetical protein